MNKLVLKQIKSVMLSDLVSPEWFDISVDKELSSGEAIDVADRSWAST